MSMDSNNLGPTQPDPQPPIDVADWRSQLQPESRLRMFNKIMETLKKRLPFDDQAGLLELRQIAIRFEETIYSTATSEGDYLRKISLKMITMEQKSSMPSNFACVSRNPQDSGLVNSQREVFQQLKEEISILTRAMTALVQMNSEKASNDQVGSQTMLSQVHNQSQSVPLQMVPNQSQTRQQLISHDMQNIAPGGSQTAAAVYDVVPAAAAATNAAHGQQPHTSNNQHN